MDRRATPARTAPSWSPGPWRWQRVTKQFRLLVLFTPLLVSLLLTGAGAILQILDIHMPWLQLLGEPFIALLTGLIGTCLLTRSAVGQSRIEEAITNGYKESGQILILNGVGGCLAATVAAAGLGDVLGGFFSAGTGTLFMVHVTSNTLWLLQSPRGHSVRGRSNR